MSEILVWPTSIIPNKMSWQLAGNNIGFTSPFTGDDQVVEFPGSRWIASLQFENVKDSTAPALESLIWSLNGRAGRIKLWDFAAGYLSNPRIVQGAPVVAAANQQGRLLTTRGWLPDVVVLRLGDWFEVNGELKRVTADCVSDGVGNATLRFTPMLRRPPPAGTPLTVDRPCGTFRLQDDKQGEFARERKRIIRSAVTLNFTETWST